MTVTAPKRPLSDEAALAALDSPEATADRHLRAVEAERELSEWDRNRLVNMVGYEARGVVAAAYRTNLFDHMSDRAFDAAQDLVRTRITALVVRQLEAHLRIADENALWADPDRLEDRRIWNAYLQLVESTAFQRGDKAAEFIATWQRLIANRADAESVGESTASMDRRLEALRVPYPKLPDAAWITADTLGGDVRDQELARLEAKYGPRAPDPAPTKRIRK